MITSSHDSIRKNWPHIFCFLEVLKITGFSRGLLSLLRTVMKYLHFTWSLGLWIEFSLQTSNIITPPGLKKCEDFSNPALFAMNSAICAAGPWYVGPEPTVLFTSGLAPAHSATTLFYWSVSARAVSSAVIGQFRARVRTRRSDWFVFLHVIGWSDLGNDLHHIAGISFQPHWPTNHNLEKEPNFTLWLNRTELLLYFK